MFTCTTDCMQVSEKTREAELWKKNRWSDFTACIWKDNLNWACPRLEVFDTTNVENQILSEREESFV